MHSFSGEQNIESSSVWEYLWPSKGVACRACLRETFNINYVNNIMSQTNEDSMFAFGDNFAYMYFCEDHTFLQ